MCKLKELLKKKRKKIKGLTLVEIIVVLIIVTIVTLGFGSSASKQVKRTNRETVVNEMQVLASNMSDAYYDLGNPVYDPATAEGMAQFRNFLGSLSSDYISFNFDFSTLKATNNGFFIKVDEPKDVWEQKYCCWFVTSDINNRYVMVVSGGDDGLVGDGTEISGIPSITGYKANKYGDDIVLIVKPKLDI